MSDTWRQGDNYIIDDLTGLKVWASDASRQWDGAMTHHKNFETRHPQDFVRAVRDDQNVTSSRPRQIYTFIGPLDTEIGVASAAGSTTLHVLTSDRMCINDRLSVMLDSGDTFLCLVVSIIDETQVQITPALRGSVAVGQKVYDNTAMAQPVLP